MFTTSDDSISNASVHCAAYSVLTRCVFSNASVHWMHTLCSLDVFTSDDSISNASVHWLHTLC